jgi:hypothetical protein
MPLVLNQKGIVFTNQPMVEKGIEPLTRLVFPSLLTARKQMYLLDAALIEMLSKNLDYFKSKPVNIPKITILLDRGYHPEDLTVEVQNIYPHILTKIKFQLSNNPLKNKKKPEVSQDLFL